MVNFLLERGADLNLVDMVGQPPLTYAIESANESIIKSLLDHDAKPHRAVNHRGKKLTSYWKMPPPTRILLEEGEAAWRGEY